jgi:DNA-binding response OmpR family regulator
MLEEALWERDRETASNVIDVYIWRLRRKLTTNGAGGEDLIQTIRGIGYRLGRPT